MFTMSMLVTRYRDNCILLAATTFHFPAATLAALQTTTGYTAPNGAKYIHYAPCNS